MRISDWSSYVCSSDLKAILAAKAQDVLIEIAALGAREATTISHVPARKSLPLRGDKLRVALLGCGAVGAGVLSYLKERPDLFEVNPVLVRNPDRKSVGEGKSCS